MATKDFPTNEGVKKDDDLTNDKKINLYKAILRANDIANIDELANLEEKKNNIVNLQENDIKALAEADAKAVQNFKAGVQAVYSQIDGPTLARLTKDHLKEIVNDKGAAFQAGMAAGKEEKFLRDLERRDPPAPSHDVDHHY